MENRRIFPAQVNELLFRLRGKGIGAYVVGGAVRDILMGRRPCDYDIAAECFPEELIAAFEDCKCVDTGIRFGTLAVFSGGELIEITCCRRESGYTDLRRPDSVSFCKSIEEDLARRDFTVNAIAMDMDGNIKDPFGGREDIENGIIRCVGEPHRRFSEDALRILRALRFSSCLGFEIEEGTREAIGELRCLMASVSGERIFAELKKLLLGDNVLSVLLRYKAEICTLIPELSDCVDFDQHNSYHIYTVYDHIAHAVAECPKDTDIRLAMLLHDIGKPPLFFIDEKGIGHFWGHPELSEKMARKVLLRLKADNETVEHVCFLIKHHDIRPEATRRALWKYLTKVGYEGARELLHVRRADVLSQAPQYFYQLDDLLESERIICELEGEGAAIRISDLAVDGNDVINAGIEKGPRVGKILERLLEKVVKGELENTRESLLYHISKKKK